MIRLIAAVDDKLGIAKNGSMPWKIPEDENYFTIQTKKFGGRVLTAGKTFRDAYNSIPLIDRTNFIYTRSKNPILGANLINDLNDFIANNGDRDLWVAGGGELFSQIIKYDIPIELYLTHIKGDFGCDVFFPKFDEFELISKSEERHQNGYDFYYAVYSNQ